MFAAQKPGLPATTETGSLSTDMVRSLQIDVFQSSPGNPVNMYIRNSTLGQIYQWCPVLQHR